MDCHGLNVGELYKKLNHFKSSVVAVERVHQKLTFTTKWMCHNCYTVHLLYILDYNGIFFIDHLENSGHLLTMLKVNP